MKRKTVRRNAGPPRYRSRWPMWLLSLVIALLVLNHFYQWYPWPWEKPAAPPPVPTAQVQPSDTPASTDVKPEPEPKPQRIIDFQDIIKNTDPKLGDMITSRKKAFGLKDSVDMVVGSDEAIKVGGETVTVEDILASIDADAPPPDEQLGADASSGGAASPGAAEGLGGRLTEENLGGRMVSGSAAGGTGVKNRTGGTIRKPVSFYGIHVVRPGDNLWNIHFAVLREYLKHKGHDVASNADEARGGRSTGVARILKFAESMVHIYNMKTRKLDQNLDLLSPESKVVIFNLSRLDLILGKIKPGELDRVQYDGKDLYLPEDRPEKAGMKTEG